MTAPDPVADLAQPKKVRVEHSRPASSRAWYEGIFALVLNLAIALVLTVVFSTLRVGRGEDETESEEYEELGEQRAEELVPA